MKYCHRVQKTLLIKYLVVLKFLPLFLTRIVTKMHQLDKFLKQVLKNSHPLKLKGMWNKLFVLIPLILSNQKHTLLK